MFRSTAQVSAANTAARKLAVYPLPDGWSFWSDSPYTHLYWVTDGQTFCLAREGYLVKGRRATLAYKDLGGYMGGTRNADDTLNPMLSKKSPGCPCANCAPRKAREAALVAHAGRVRRATSCPCDRCI